VLPYSVHSRIRKINSHGDVIAEIDSRGPESLGLGTLGVLESAFSDIPRSPYSGNGIPSRNSQADVSLIIAFSARRRW